MYAGRHTTRGVAAPGPASTAWPQHHQDAIRGSNLYLDNISLSHTRRRDPVPIFDGAGARALAEGGSRDGHWIARYPVRLRTWRARCLIFRGAKRRDHGHTIAGVGPRVGEPKGTLRRRYLFLGPRPDRDRSPPTLATKHVRVVLPPARAGSDLRSWGTAAWVAGSTLVGQ